MKHILLFLLATIAAPLFAIGADRALPMDSAITYGKLPCGLSYYLLQCPRPAYKANFYLMVNVGSTVEGKGQYGFAHFVEHMAFCGSEHFPSGSLIDYLQRHGLSFGYDINASTSHDATVYDICNVDTRLGQGLVDSCLLALKDIACGLTFEPKMAEREKMVILEEWRQGNGPFRRLTDKMFPVLFGEGSRYCQMPIGTPIDVSTATADSLQAFYRKWYQPQHQAIVAIGDIDPKEIEKEIESLWADVRAPQNPSMRAWEQVPDHRGVIAGVVTDAQFPGCQMDFWFKADIPPRDERDRVSYFNNSFLGFLAQRALGRRLSDIIYENDSPFTSANAEFSQYYLADSKDGFRAFALFDRNKRQRALTRLIAEIERLRQYGISEAEMKLHLNAMRAIVDNMPVTFNEYNNYEQFNRISEHFLKGNVVLSLDDQVQAYSNFIDSVRPAHINAFVRKNLTRDNLAAMLVEKETEGGDTPSAEEFTRMISEIWDTVTVRPYLMDTAFMQPILTEKLKPGKIKSFEYDSLLFAKHYVLSNGARVALCIRDVLSDDISLRAVQRGGESALLPIDFVDGTFATDMAELGGIGSLSQTDLRRKYDGTGIDISVIHTPYAEMIEGTSRVSELEELLQLLHARLTTVRTDSTAFSNWLAIHKGMLSDLANSPDKVFGDSIRSILYLDQRPMMRKIDKADIDTLDYANALSLFKSRMADPANFDFIIVGNFEFEDVEPLIEKYIGSLPKTSGKKSVFPTFGRLAVDGVRYERFSMPSPDEATKVYMAYELHRPYSMQDEMTIYALASILEKQCIETLRKEAGGTYTPHVSTASGEADGFHSLFITFDTNAEMAGDLAAKANALISDITKNGVDPELFKMVKDYIVKSEYSATLQQDYPMTLLTHIALYGDIDPALRLPCARAVTIDMVKEMASDLLNAPVRVTLIMDQK